MSAPITEDEIAPHPDNDPSHPIPYPKVIDVIAIKKSGGADLSIIVASPLQADPRSQTRLLDKIQGYLGHIISEQFRSEAGVPTPSNTTITVVLHPDSASVIHDLLANSRDWVQSNDASLVIQLLEPRKPSAGT